MFNLAALLQALAYFFQSGGIILEDSPLWNCHTMGNRICGPR